MTSAALRFALRSSLREIAHVDPVRVGRATGLVSEVYAQCERDFGLLAPPIGLHSPAPDVLAAAWALLRESLLAEGVTRRVDRELVAAAVSLANLCPYCAEVHGMALGTLGGDAAALDGTAPGPTSDPGARAVAQWAGGEGGLRLPRGEAVELTAVAATFHYVNRMVAVFLGPSPLPAALPGPVRSTARSVLGRLLRPRTVPPGAALRLLPDAALPADLQWLLPNKNLADAFARASAVVETAARRVVPPRVRALVRSELAGWDGKTPGVSRSWVESALAELPGAERPAARLALVAAKAAYQVDAELVAAFRVDEPGDRELVEFLSWVSFAAATSAAARLHATACEEKTEAPPVGEARRRR